MCVLINESKGLKRQGDSKRPERKADRDGSSGEVLIEKLQLSVGSSYNLPKPTQEKNKANLWLWMKFKQWLNTSTSRAGEMAQHVKALATKTDDLSSILRLHLVERENSLPQLVLHAYAMAHVERWYLRRTIWSPWFQSQAPWLSLLHIPRLVERWLGPVAVIVLCVHLLMESRWGVNTLSFLDLVF